VALTVDPQWFALYSYWNDDTADISSLAALFPLDDDVGFACYYDLHGNHGVQSSFSFGKLTRLVDGLRLEGHRVLTRDDGWNDSYRWADVPEAECTWDNSDDNAHPLVVTLSHLAAPKPGRLPWQLAFDVVHAWRSPLPAELPQGPAGWQRFLSGK